MHKLIGGLVLALGVLAQAPTANAGLGIGNYDLRIPDRYDFHKWMWAFSRCGDSCRIVQSIAQPIARGANYIGQAHLAGGQWTLVVDVPDGLRCGNVYYGQTIPTHDVYTWDDNSLVGTLTSTFDAGCDGQPGVLTYPFSLVRM